MKLKGDTESTHDLHNTGESIIHVPRPYTLSSHRDILQCRLIPRDNSNLDRNKLKIKKGGRSIQAFLRSCMMRMNEIPKASLRLCRTSYKVKRGGIASTKETHANKRELKK